MMTWPHSVHNLNVVLPKSWLEDISALFSMNDGPSCGEPSEMFPLLVTKEHVSLDCRNNIFNLLINFCLTTTCLPQGACFTDINPSIPMANFIFTDEEAGTKWPCNVLKITRLVKGTADFGPVFVSRIQFEQLMCALYGNSVFLYIHSRVIIKNAKWHSHISWSIYPAFKKRLYTTQRGSMRNAQALKW